MGKRCARFAETGRRRSFEASQIALRFRRRIIDVAVYTQSFAEVAQAFSTTRLRVLAMDAWKLWRLQTRSGEHPENCVLRR
jgi:hypothetical protein